MENVDFKIKSIISERKKKMQIFTSITNMRVYGRSIRITFKQLNVLFLSRYEDGNDLLSP